LILSDLLSIIDEYPYINFVLDIKDSGADYEKIFDYLDKCINDYVTEKMLLMFRDNDTNNNTNNNINNNYKSNPEGRSGKNKAHKIKQKKLTKLNKKTHKLNKKSSQN